MIAKNQPTIHFPIELLRKVKIEIYKTLDTMSNTVPDYFKELGEKKNWVNENLKLQRKKSN